MRVDHDYVLNAAQIAKEQGCKHFNFMSTMSADKNSSLLYARTKVSKEDMLICKILAQVDGHAL